MFAALALLFDLFRRLRPGGAAVPVAWPQPRVPDSGEPPLDVWLFERERR